MIAIIKSSIGERLKVLRYVNNVAHTEEGSVGSIKSTLPRNVYGTLSTDDLAGVIGLYRAGHKRGSLSDLKTKASTW